MSRDRAKVKGPRPPQDVLLEVRVIPRARRSEVAGTRDNAVLIRLNAPPVDGAANKELIAVLAATLDVPKSAISIVSGESGRAKRIAIAGLTGAEVQARLGRG